MKSDEIKQVIRQLAYEWAMVELPTHRLTYTDYLSTIAGLNVVTDDPDRTATIVAAVLHQAKQLGYSSEWVQQELKFEARVEATGERNKWLRLELVAGELSDAALDQYNERLTRFI